MRPEGVVGLLLAAAERGSPRHSRVRVKAFAALAALLGADEPGVVTDLMHFLRGSKAEAEMALRMLRGLVALPAPAGGAGTSQAGPAPTATPAASFAAAAAAAPDVLRRLAAHLSAWCAAGAAQPIRCAVQVLSAACRAASRDQLCAIDGVDELQQAVARGADEALKQPGRLELDSELLAWCRVFSCSSPDEAASRGA